MKALITLLAAALLLAAYVTAGSTVLTEADIDNYDASKKIGMLDIVQTVPGDIKFVNSDGDEFEFAFTSADDSLGGGLEADLMRNGMYRVSVKLGEAQALAANQIDSIATVAAATGGKGNTGTGGNGSDGDSGGFPLAAIIGCAVGGVVVILIVGAVVYKRSERTELSGSESTAYLDDAETGMQANDTYASLGGQNKAVSAGGGQAEYSSLTAGLVMAVCLVGVAVAAGSAGSVDTTVALPAGFLDSGNCVMRFQVLPGTNVTFAGTNAESVCDIQGLAEDAPIRTNDGDNVVVAEEEAANGPGRTRPEEEDLTPADPDAPPSGCSCTEWAREGPCNAECGGGQQLLVRSCTGKGGEEMNLCEGVREEKAEPCNEQACPEPEEPVCECGAWEQGACSAVCGGGLRKDTRTCPLKLSGEPCDEVEREVTCNDHNCPCDPENPSWACEWCTAGELINLAQWRNVSFYEDNLKQFQVIDGFMDGFFAMKDTSIGKRFCLEPNNPMSLAEYVDAIAHDVTMGDIEDVAVPPAFDNVLDEVELIGLAATFDGIKFMRFEFPLQTRSTYDVIPSIFQINRVRLILFVGRNSMAQSILPGFELHGYFTISDDIDLYTLVRWEQHVLNAQIRSETPIPVGKLAEALFSALPGGDLVERTGLFSFEIGRPSITARWETNAPSNAAVRVSGVPAIGDWGAEWQTELVFGRMNNQNVVAVGVACTGATISRMVHAVTGGLVFDAFDFFGTDVNMGIAVSTAPIDSSTPYMMFDELVADGVLRRTQVVAGLSVLVEARFPEDCGTDRFCEFCRTSLQFNAGGGLLLRAKVELAQFTLEAGVSDIQLNDKNRLTEVSLYGKVGVQTGFGLRVQLETSLDSQPEPLVFTGTIGIEVATASLKLLLEMKNLWREPFGQRYVAIGNLRLGVELTVAYPFAKGFELGGRLEFGRGSSKEGHCRAQDLAEDGNCMGGEAYGGVDLLQPQNGYFHAQVEAITIGKLLRMFERGDLITSKPVLDTGFPKPLRVSYTARPGGVDLTDTKEGFKIPQGLYIEGAIRVLDELEAEAKLHIKTPDYLSVKASMKKFDFIPGVAFYRSAANKVDGPSFELTVQPSKGTFVLRMEGLTQIFGIALELEVIVSPTHYKFRHDLDLFGGWRFAMTAEADYREWSKVNFNLEFSVKLDESGRLAEFLEDVYGDLAKAIDDAESALAQAHQDCIDLVAVDCNKCKRDECSKAQAGCRSRRDRRWLGDAIDDVGDAIGDAWDGVTNWFGDAYDATTAAALVAWCKTKNLACDGAETVFNGLCKAACTVTPGLCAPVKAAELTAGWVGDVHDFVAGPDRFALHGISFGTGIRLDGFTLPAFMEVKISYTAFGKRYDDVTFGFNFQNLIATAGDLVDRHIIQKLKSDHSRRVRALRAAELLQH